MNVNCNLKIKRNNIQTCHIPFKDFSKNADNYVSDKSWKVLTVTLSILN